MGKLCLVGPLVAATLALAVGCVQDKALEQFDLAPGGVPDSLLDIRGVADRKAPDVSAETVGVPDARDGEDELELAEAVDAGTDVAEVSDLKVDVGWDVAEVSDIEVEVIWDVAEVSDLEVIWDLVEVSDVEVDVISDPAEVSDLEVVCVADCENKECGDDGCDGSCGACAAEQYCSVGTCHDLVCPQNFVCHYLTQFTKEGSEWEKSIVDVFSYSWDSGQFVSVSHMVLGDADNDGKEEIWLSLQTDQSGTEKLLQYKWTGESWIRTGIAGIASPDRLVVGDANNDSLNEVYVSSEKTEVHQIMHLAGSWASLEVAVLSAWAIRDLQIGDGDNDGLRELYVGDAQSSYCGDIYSFEWVNGQWTSTLIAADQAMNYIAVADGDNDGENELYVTTSGHGNYPFDDCDEWTELHEYEWNGASWVDNIVFDVGAYGGAIYGMAVGDGNNNGSNKVYVNHVDGFKQFAFSGGTWSQEVIEIDNIGGGYVIASISGLSNCLYGNNKEVIYEDGSWQYSIIDETNAVVYDNVVVVADGNHDGQLELYTIGRLESGGP